MDDLCHRGTVERIDNQTIYVRIEQNGACKDCHVASSCLAVEKKEKIIEATDFTDNFSLQEEVIVSVRQAMGLSAVVLAYALPIVLVIVFVVVGIHVSGNEVIGGVGGLLVLIPYYFILFLFRKRIKKRFVFSLSKMTN